MGKIKDPQLFLLIKNFLLVYLPVQRKLSGNTVTTYRTVLNQFLAPVLLYFSLFCLPIRRFEAAE